MTTDDVTREILTKAPRLQAAIEKAADEMRTIRLPQLKQAVDKAAIAMGIDPDDAPTPPVLDISETERNALWALIDAFVGSVFESAKAQCREAHASSDYISELSDEVDRTCAALRSALGFEQGE